MRPLLSCYGTDDCVKKLIAEELNEVHAEHGQKLIASGKLWSISR